MEDNRVKVRSKSKDRSKSKEKSFNLKKIPKIIFGRSESEKQEEIGEISGVIQGSFSKNVSFVVDDKGTLDLSTVPKEFQEVVQKLFEKVTEQKFLTGDSDDRENKSTPAVVRRKGPRVEKGMKDEEVLNEMKGLVNSGDPWNIYKKSKPGLNHYSVW